MNTPLSALIFVYSLYYAVAVVAWAYEDDDDDGGVVGYGRVRFERASGPGIVLESTITARFPRAKAAIRVSRFHQVGANGRPMS